MVENTLNQAYSITHRHDAGLWMNHLHSGAWLSLPELWDPSDLRFHLVLLRLPTKSGQRPMPLPQVWCGLKRDWFLDFPHTLKRGVFIFLVQSKCCYLTLEIPNTVRERSYYWVDSAKVHNGRKTPDGKRLDTHKGVPPTGSKRSTSCLLISPNSTGVKDV